MATKRSSGRRCACSIGAGSAWQDAWLKVGRFLRFTERIETLTTDALRVMLNTSEGSLPPFIAVHIRRGDFEDVRGLTDVDRFQRALERVRRRLRRGDRALVPYRATAPPEPPLHPSVPVRPGHAEFVPAHLRDLRVVCGTDETDETWISEVLVPALGCVFANHTELDTVAKYGSAWGPSVLDAAIFSCVVPISAIDVSSRAQGFVGTADSTFSGLAALRVKYWQRGIVDHARAPYEQPVDRLRA